MIRQTNEALPRVHSRNITRRGEDLEKSLSAAQQKERTLPSIRQTEETLPRVHSSQGKSHKVSTKLFNNFFQRESVEDDKKSEQWQKSMWSVDWWLGFRIFPLVENSASQPTRF